MEMTKEIPRSNDLPVTVGMFNEFRSEISAKISGMDARIDGLEAKMESRFEGVFEQLHQIRVLVETQTAQNVIALDGVRHALAEVAEVRRLQEKNN
jgi:hypothetical protein